MAEATARKKFDCPACGAEAEWRPAKAALVCGYCGTTAPAQVDLSPGGEETIREHDLVAAMRSIPDSQRGWQAQKTSVRCQSCQAISVFDPERVSQSCDFCGATALVPHDEVKQAFRPESLLEMRLSQAQVREQVRGWYGSRWFAPNKLKRAALTDTVHGLYIPYWTFDAQVRAHWTAQSGYYYYVTEHYRDSKGQSRTRQVRKIRWRPSSGSLDHFFDDELVAASQGVQPGLLRRVEPFPTDELKPYHAGFLSGWVVERYQIDLIAAAQHARAVMDRKLERLCAAEVPGDTHRDLRVDAHYTNQTFKHILVPVWLVSYRYGPKHFQVVINGFTGKIAGQYPKSWIKITLAALGVLALIALIIWVVIMTQQ